MSPTHPPASIVVHGETFVPYISEDEIRLRVGEIAAELERLYSGKHPVALGVLNGAFMFYADLLRTLCIDCEVDFIKISSYGQNKSSSQDVRLVLEPQTALEGRHVILIEDIVDSGYSIDFLKKYLESRRVASFVIVTLLHKPDCAIIRHPIDFVGFTIPPKFVIGYGLDYAQQARYLPSIYIRSGE